MKKIFLAIAVLGIVSVAACSKKDSDDSKTNNDTTTTTPNPQEVAIDVESVTVPTDTFPTDSGTDVVLTTVTEAQATTID